MTTIYKDDITGEEYSSDMDMMEFAIVQDGTPTDSFDAHLTTFHDNPEAVADELHARVDDWLEATLEWAEEELENEH